MVRFFCPRCWADFAEDIARCPKCGLDIPAFLASKEYVDRLILALGHPEKGTPVRAAWLLGQLRRPEAVEPLIPSIRNARDVYPVRAAVKALGMIGTPEAIEFLKTLCSHPACTVSQEAVSILRDRSIRLPTDTALEKNERLHGRRNA